MPNFTAILDACVLYPAPLRNFLMRYLYGNFQPIEVSDVFDSPDTYKQLCLMSGGHVRGLVNLMRTAIEHTDQLPITARAARRAVSELRNKYRETVDATEWTKLAQISCSKRIENNESHRRMLFDRKTLEYRYIDANDEVCCWHDVHPVIYGTPEFQAALQASSSLQTP